MRSMRWARSRQPRCSMRAPPGSCASSPNRNASSSARGATGSASTDPLTGLANHRAFHERLLAEVKRAHRYRRPLSLAVIDIDNFKRVNDVTGHETGDRVLADIAAELRSIARSEDVLARIGGDE